MMSAPPPGTPLISKSDLLGAVSVFGNQVPSRPSTKKGQVKITDFGLAKLADAMKHTKTDTIMGTTAYKSPEQIQAFGTDHRTDMWTFGVVLYKMITGILPFQGDYEAAMIYEILNEESKAIQLFRSDVPENIIKLISTLLPCGYNEFPTSGKVVFHFLIVKRESINNGGFR